MKSLLFCLFYLFLVLIQTTKGELELPEQDNSTTGCEEHTSCSECQPETNCLWCENEKACIEGHWYGPDKQDKCKDWRWKQCYISGLYAMIGVCGLVGVFTCCCCTIIIRCCCCKKQKKNKHELQTFKEYKTLASQQEEQESLLEKSKSRHPKTDAKRAELKKKYGLEDP